ncbi:hypothetical protein O181_027709 [Austropuccinia psidii MF-1]|uniref:Uncharacterized protein n=1 Tax=Austropuccinia psidii MF-1 TaxID=1389203 RepID=A0A9Q3CMI3_9BASI|nr:hypothetical protein [Austropuccinia psidii MF-1]
MEGAETSRKEGRGPGEDGQEEEEGSEGTEGVSALVGASQGTGGPTLAQSNHPEPFLLPIMQQMTHSMANLQAASSSEEPRPPTSKTLPINVPECFDGTRPFKVRSFIQTC